MKRTVFIALFPLLLFGQKRTIDSINNLPYDVKINRAATIDTLFVRNAENAAKIKYNLGVADSYGNLGLIYYYRGQYDKSVSARLKAIKGYEAANHKAKLAHEYGELGYAMKRRNMSLAQRYMQKAMAIAERDSIVSALAPIYDNYGVLKEMQGQLDSAALFYKRSLSLKYRMSDSIGIPYSLSNLAGIHVIRKQFAQAVPLYDKALEIRRRRKDFVGMAESYSNIGSMYLESGQYAPAIENFGKAIDFALKSGYIHNAAANYKSLADLYEKRGDKSLALDNYKNYVLYKDSILNRETNAKIAEMEVAFETGRKEKLILRQQAEARLREIQIIAISIIALFVGAVGWLVYRQQRLKNRQQAQEHELKSAIAQIETQNKLQRQRLEISRDLHDNIGAQLTFIISSMDNIRYAFDLKNTKLDEKLQGVGNFARETIVELRDTIWAMNHSEIALDDLRARLLNFIEKAKEAVGEIEFGFTIDQSLAAIRLTSVQGMNLYRTIQEAINNALKYASARQISISIAKQADDISISVVDDGSGFDQSQARLGNGILNMRHRVVSIGGMFRIESSPGKGTRIEILIPASAKSHD